jgi:hypothetical protein
MADWTNPEPTFSTGNETLWTENMTGGCNSLATFCLKSKKRSLTHIKGGDLLPEQLSTFAKKVAQGLDGDYELIWISGTESLLQSNFKGLLDKISNAVLDEVINLGKNFDCGDDHYFMQNANGYMQDDSHTVIVPTAPNWTTFKKGSFAIDANGNYGLAQR